MLPSLHENCSLNLWFDLVLRFEKAQWCESHSNLEGFDFPPSTANTAESGYEETAVKHLSPFPIHHANCSGAEILFILDN